LDKRTILSKQSHHQEGPWAELDNPNTLSFGTEFVFVRFGEDYDSKNPKK